MSTKHKKMVAPIVIAIILIIYYVAIGYYMIAGEAVFSFLEKMLLIVVPLGLSSVTIYVLYQRIIEIEGGEEEDLDKY